MTLLDKPFKEPAPGPWPVWVIALIVAFGVGTCQAHATEPAHQVVAPTRTTTTTTTVPVPRLSKTLAGVWPIAAPGYFNTGPTRGDRGIGEGFYSGTMFVEGGITPDDNGAGGNFWCGTSGWEYNIGAASGYDHLCTWPELKAQGWVRGKQSKPTYDFICGYDPCTAEQLKKAEYYEAGLHPLATLPRVAP